MKKLFIHVGMHKAGSTSIQTALNTQRDLLNDHGIFVPATGTDGYTRAHHNIAWELNREDRFEPDQGSLADLHLELSRANPEKAIISSEGFTSLDTRPGLGRERFLQKIASAGAAGDTRYGRIKDLADSLGYAVVIVGFLRDYASCMNSAYTQQIKTFKHARSFDEYVAAQRRNDRWRYADVFLGWESIADEMRCFPNGEDNVQTLFEMMGVATVEQQAKRRNGGVGPKTIECSRILFRALEGEQQNVLSKDRSRKTRDREKVHPHRAVRAAAKALGWDKDAFWGFDFESATSLQEEFVERDRAFLQRHGVHFSSSFARKIQNDLCVTRMSSDERELFMTQIKPVLRTFGLESAL